MYHARDKVLAAGFGRAFVFALVTAACATRLDTPPPRSSVGMEVPPAALDDAPYAEVLARWTQRGSLHRQFQKRLDVEAVLMTEEFRRAYLARWSRLRGDRQPQLEELGNGKLGVFVSIYTPESAFMALGDKRLWSFVMKFGDRMLTPTEVRQVVDKPVFEPFFPFISRWSEEYLLVFDAYGEPSTGNEAPAIPQSVSVEMRSALAQVAMTWQ